MNTSYIYKQKFLDCYNGWNRIITYKGSLKEVQTKLFTLPNMSHLLQQMLYNPRDTIGVNSSKFNGLVIFRSKGQVITFAILKD